MHQTREFLLAVTSMGLLACFAAAPAFAQTAPLVVSTQQGPIEGSVVSGTRRFAGVRYAAAPIGTLRWAPPQLPASHTGVAAATSFGSQCPQATGTGGPNEKGSLDCLFLNIYTPRSGKLSALPVMMFIHGGSFTSGSGAGYYPFSMVQQANVVVVTINYRLGLEGSLALPGLDAENPALGSGDYALLDQQAAIAWLHANIANFGGNPGNITVWGESAGASYTCDNVASPLTSGQFRAAIAESGCSLGSLDKPDAETYGTSVAQLLGCTSGGQVDLTCMRAQTPAAVSTAALKLADGSITTQSAPVYGGGVLPAAAIAALQSGSFNHVPLLLGNNADEGNLFVYTGVAGPIPYTDAIYDEDITTIIAPATGLSASSIEAAYPVSHYQSPEAAYSALFGDAVFACPTLSSDTFAAADTPVFGYQFSDPAGGLFGSSHTAELDFLFNMGMKFSAAQQTLSTQMIAYWTNFARSQTPNATGVPTWPAFNQLQNLKPSAVAPFTSAHFGNMHQCAFWDTAPDTAASRI